MSVDEYQRLNGFDWRLRHSFDVAILGAEVTAFVLPPEHVEMMKSGTRMPSCECVIQTGFRNDVSLSLISPCPSLAHFTNPTSGPMLTVYYRKENKGFRN